jgi:hypothetical protein
MASQLPNGKQQFLDATGTPLVAGTVTHYVPGTTTPKNTYQDTAGTVLNTNPVVLDAAGEALIRGTGSFRQIVKDVLGNTIWDQVADCPMIVDASGNLNVSGLIAATGKLQAGADAVSGNDVPRISQFANGSGYIKIPRNATTPLIVQYGMVSSPGTTGTQNYAIAFPTSAFVGFVVPFSGVAITSAVNVLNQVGIGWIFGSAPTALYYLAIGA